MGEAPETSTGKALETELIFKEPGVPNCTPRKRNMKKGKGEQKEQCRERYKELVKGESRQYRACAQAYTNVMDADMNAEFMGLFGSCQCMVTGDT